MRVVRQTTSVGHWPPSVTRNEGCETDDIRGSLAAVGYTE